MSWLNNQSPNSVLLVSLGSGGTLTSEQLTELALGLEMSKQKFIWVVRKPDDLNACGAFFDVGRDNDDPLSYLPEGFVKRTSGVGLMVPSWAPQVPILRNEATGEQKMNATLLAEEIAVAVKPVALTVEAGEKKAVKREEVARVVRLLMESEEGKVMKVKANELKESAAKALKSGGSSFDLLSSVVESWN
ncbi:Hydroquinone glucosyltransferase-like protein [Heracleum sosnowskyi]|uniref:Hydroquinone glucosyltransferase-like protein n=1 Tax=Heracleum sosnowskyi TaxID=360622 RepID=A0AAD8INV0_9APIA|nr:Hydroquinone glucosyltransferase-like protein [Heracleum sosnowskyi]